MTLTKKMLAVLVIAGWAGSANAIPITFTHTGVVDSVDGDASALTSVGDVVTIEVIADNGGTDLISQSWDSLSDTISATFSAGSYFASFVEDWFGGAGFQTNAAGELIQTNWFGTGDTPVSSTDNFGTGVYLYNVGVNVSTGGTINSATAFGTVSNWSVAIGDTDTGTVPAPATLALLGFGLAGLGWSRRKKA